MNNYDQQSFEQSSKSPQENVEQITRERNRQRKYAEYMLGNSIYRSYPIIINGPTNLEVTPESTPISGSETSEANVTPIAAIKTLVQEAYDDIQKAA